MPESLETMAADELDFDEAVAALRWWRESGVDGALAPLPRDRFRESADTPARPPAAAALAQPAARPAIVAAGVEEAGRGSRALAVAAQNLDALRAAMESFDGCGLKATATQLVFGDGEVGARVMFVGEGPGGDEDRIGRPFVGRAGQLLDRMLVAIGLNRAEVYIANVVPWRPPGNRAPTPLETQICLPFIRRQIELVGPDLLVCLGASATQTLLGVKEGITRARGNWRDYSTDEGRTIRALAMLHPAYLLRQPSHKRLAWRDFQALAAALRQTKAP